MKKGVGLSVPDFSLQIYRNKDVITLSPVGRTRVRGTERNPERRGTCPQVEGMSDRE